jgi:hypothetical protein
MRQALKATAVVGVIFFASGLVWAVRDAWRSSGSAPSASHDYSFGPLQAVVVHLFSFSISNLSLLLLIVGAAFCILGFVSWRSLS